ncbi:MAG: hypothetical protein HPY64_13580 [Anaerolineae bacterium]|nr:hypothetical protein [Anaerolineae bacterium]
MNRKMARDTLLLLVVGLVLSACQGRPPIVVPTLLVLPSVTPTAVATAAPLVTATPPPVLPTATFPTATPTLSPTPRPTLVSVASISHAPDQLVTGLHPGCQPQLAQVRAVLSAPAEVQVLLQSYYIDRPTSRPGVPMQPLGPAEFAATLGPYTQAGTILYRVVVLRGGEQAISEDRTLEVLDCPNPTPLPTNRYGVSPTVTPTPPYGAALSVRAASQTVVLPPDTPTTIFLTWEGGLPPYVIDRVTQPRYGALDGAGPMRVYIPQPGFSGIDSFTFVVTDGNGQASMGTITLLVGIEPSVTPPG